jgi:hypothetical protein
MADKVLGGPSVSPVTAADLDTITIRISKGARMVEERDDRDELTGKMVKAVEQGEPGPRPDAGEPWLLGAGFTARTSEGKKTSGIPTKHEYPAKVVAAMKVLRDYVLEAAQEKISGARTINDI